MCSHLCVTIKKYRMKEFWKRVVSACRSLRKEVGHEGFDAIVVSQLVTVCLGWIRPLWVVMVAALLLSAAINALKKCGRYDSCKPLAIEWICSFVGVLLGIVVVQLLTM